MVTACIQKSSCQNGIPGAPAIQAPRSGGCRPPNTPSGGPPNHQMSLRSHVGSI